MRDVCRDLLINKVIQQASAERKISVTQDEIQAEANRIRRQNRLEKASETLAWLDEQLITADDWEAGIRDRLLSQKLAQCLFSKDIDKYFAEHRLDFDCVQLYQIVVPYEKLAIELFYQIEEEEISFYEAAHLYDIDESRRYRCGYEGKLYRWSLKPDIAAVVFGAASNQVIRPIKTEQGHHVLMVDKFIRAELTLEIKREIVDRLFQEWLTAELNYLLYNSAPPAEAHQTQEN